MTKVQSSVTTQLVAFDFLTLLMMTKSLISNREQGRGGKEGHTTSSIADNHLFSVEVTVNGNHSFS